MASVVSRNAVERVHGRRLPMAALTAAVVSMLANLAVFWAMGAAGVPFQVPMGGPTGPVMPLPMGAVALLSAVPAFVAALIVWALARFTSRPWTIFFIISAVFLVVSFAPAFLLPIPFATQIGLNVLHVVAAVAIVWTLRSMAQDVQQ